MSKNDLLKLQAKLEKSFGKDSVMFASDIPPYRVVSTGSISLDFAIGIGGLPTNRVVEIAGEPGTGKSTLALHIVDNFLKDNPERGALYIDMESRMTPDWLNAFVDEPERVIIVKPDHVEEATDIYTEAIKSGAISVVIFDSIGGSPTIRTTEKSATIGNYGGNALGVSRFANAATTLGGKYDVCTVGINQVRDDMDGYNRLMTPGGKAWKHAASLRIELKRGKEKLMEKIREEELQVGYDVIAKIHKNSLSAPFRQCSYWFYNIECSKGFGVDTLDEIVRLSLLTGVVERTSTVGYYHASIGKVNGRDNMIKAIKDSPEATETIKNEVLQQLNEGHTEGVVSSFDEMERSDSNDTGIDYSVRYGEKK